MKNELIAEKEKNRILEEKINKMWKVFSEEREKNKDLELKLNDNYKKIRMLNQGSDNLDKLLALGQPPEMNWGLGYHGATSQNSPCLTNMSNFLSGGTTQNDNKEKT